MQANPQYNKLWQQQKRKCIKEEKTLSKLEIQYDHKINKIMKNQKKHSLNIGLMVSFVIILLPDNNLVLVKQLPILYILQRVKEA